MWVTLHVVRGKGEEVSHKEDWDIEYTGILAQGSLKKNIKVDWDIEYVGRFTQGSLKKTIEEMPAEKMYNTSSNASSVQSSHYSNKQLAWSTMPDQHMHCQDQVASTKTIHI